MGKQGQVDEVCIFTPKVVERQSKVVHVFNQNALKKLRQLLESHTFGKITQRLFKGEKLMTSQIRPKIICSLIFLGVLNSSGGGVKGWC